jgi:class 3 adenylate cyclase/HAMP domain-containing protein
MKPQVRRFLVLGACFAGLAALAAAVYLQRDRLAVNPLESRFPFRYPVSVAVDGEGNLYTIDDKYFRVLKLDPEGRAVYSLGVHPDKPRTHYEYYNELAADAEGRLYAARVVYFLDSEKVDYEEIARYSPAGRKERVLYRLEHGEDEDAYDTRLLTLQLQGEHLYFDVREGERIELWRVPRSGGEAEMLFTLPGGETDLYQIAGIAPGSLFVSSYSGDRVFFFGRDATLQPIPAEQAQAGGFSLVLADKLVQDGAGNLYIADLFSQCIFRRSPAGEFSLFASPASLSASEAGAGEEVPHTVFKDLWITESGSMAAIEAVGNRLVLFGPDGRVERVLAHGLYSWRMRLANLSVWLEAAALAALFVFTNLYVYLRILNRRVALVLKLVLAFVPVVVLMIALISTWTFKRMYTRYVEEVYNRLAVLAQAGQKMVDAEAVARLTRPSDYLGGDYNRVQGALAALVNEGQDRWNQRIYTHVDRLYNGVFYIMADMDATYGVLYPHLYTPPEYLRAWESGELALVEYTDADGTFLEAVAPLRGSSGQTAGLLYVGSSKDDFLLLHKVFVSDLVKAIAAATVVFLVVLLAVVVFLLQSINRLRGGVARMAGGEWDTQVAIRSRDEIGELGSGFNVMSRTIRTYIDEITRISTAYSRFVPREFLKFLQKESIVDIRLGNQVQLNMTILFSDIRSFTAMSETLTPQENFNFLNSYLSRIGPVIRKNHGFIDKYIGDAIMALFPGEPENAVRAALEMQRELEVYNGHRKNTGYAPIRIGIGLHTGSVMLGILGEEERLEGTVISDAVNLSSRLQALTKTYGAKTIFSESVLAAVRDPRAYRYRRLDRVVVEGRKKPVSIYELFQTDSPEDVRWKQKTRPHFEKAVSLFQAGQLAEAQALFRAILKAHPDDRAASSYQVRCRRGLHAMAG